MLWQHIVLQCMNPEAKHADLILKGWRMIAETLHNRLDQVMKDGFGEQAVVEAPATQD